MSRRKNPAIKLVAVVAAILAAGSVHAQSSVTLYGVLDAGLLYTSRAVNAGGTNIGHRFSLMDSGLSGSNFGLRGTEDLGGGLSAIFDLESGIDMANGGFGNSNGNFFGRQTWVALNGGFGTVRAGLQYSPFVLSLISTDPRNASYFGSAGVIYVGNVLATGLFNPNAISYTSPVIAGFQGSAMMALGGQAGDFRAGWQYSARLKYEFDGLVIDAALYSSNAGGTAASTPVPTTVTFSGRTIGAGYTFESLMLKAVFINFKVAGSFDNRVYGGGFGYQITPALLANAGAWYTSDGNDTANHSILVGAGATYSLSKATSLYSQVAFVKNHGKMNTGLALNGALYEGSGSTTGVNVGMRHVF
ncbi:porin [Paraburkholderia sp. CNPSo 3272]|uniref:porin n=1 Tax=Paraburkholderia sp. CNPSo 3272 TaxID=2940931 RepID=UPI0020B7EE30|nr:porin [Paraburkholderia sp. CNPSo 3272]MCP3728479.1 porin [Paraburkholderia sp. CNPSo 3272]